MTEIRIKIQKLTEEDNAKIKLKGKDPKNYSYKYTVISGEIMCGVCDERMKCITNKKKCKLYEMDGKSWFSTTEITIGQIVNTIKKEAGEL
jgi:transcription initiation factor IIE alpha subunit